MNFANSVLKLANQLLSIGFFNDPKIDFFATKEGEEKLRKKLHFGASVESASEPSKEPEHQRPPPQSDKDSNHHLHLLNRSPFGIHFLEKLLSDKLIASLSNVDDSPFGGLDPVLASESAKLK